MKQKFNAAFWKWFGDSKVVDANGDPLVLYHGTFKKQKFSNFKTPAYFSESPEYANLFRFIEIDSPYNKYESDNGYVYSVYLSIQDPLDLTFLKIKDISHVEFMKILNECLRSSIFDPYQYDDRVRGPAWMHIRNLVMNHRKIISELSDMFDGIVQVEEAGMGKRRRESLSWIAFEASQIKSTDNDGTWDVDDVDIRSNPRRRR